MAEFTIVVKLDTRQAKSNSKQLENSLGGLERKVQGIASGFKAVTSLYLVKEATRYVKALIDLGDAYTNIQNRLRTVTDTSEQLASVTDSLFQIANRTRSSFAGTAEVYARIGLSAKELGRSQQELLNFTESLNKAVILSGASSQEASAGLIQLSQGLASGALRGDELRSVLEQLPAVADVIAKHLGVTRGQLRQLGQEGALSAQIVLDAFKEARQELDERFAKTVPTVGQAFEVLQNNIIGAIGKFNEVTGFSKTLAEDILKLANAMQKLGDFTLRAAAFFKALDTTLAEVPDKLGQTGKTILGIITGVPIIGADPAVKKSIGQIAREAADTFSDEYTKEAAKQQWGVKAMVAALQEVSKEFERRKAIKLPPIEAIVEPIQPSRGRNVSSDPLEQTVRNLRDTAQQFEDIKTNVSDFPDLGKSFKDSAAGTQLLKVGLESATDALINFVDTGKFGIFELAKVIRDAALRLLLQTGAKALGLPGFQHGGSFRVGGVGGPDSQLVAFKASPGEQVTVAPPNVNVNPQVHLGIVNVQNQEEAWQAVARTHAGTRTIMNVIGDNAGAVRKLLAV